MNAASPDELALVEGVAAQGYIFRGKNAEGVISIERKRDNKIYRFELLNTLDFNSTRKRMSVIIRDCETQKVSILCKGADSIVIKLLKQNTNSDVIEKTQQYIDIYAEEGLRTLLLAKKDLDDGEYEEWNAKFQAA